MSEEENKIINYLKELSKYELFLDNIFIKDKTARQILVSAYNKLKRQQKEIEGKNAVIDTYKHSEKVLTEQIDEQEKEIEEYKKFKKDIVSKIMFWDKEELPDNERIISMLDTLMEEVSRLEDIEDKKIEAAIDFIGEKRDKFWKDKIREKIEHYNNELEHIKNGEEFENEKPMYYWGKAALEVLLEEK